MPPEITEEKKRELTQTLFSIRDDLNAQQIWDTEGKYNTVEEKKDAINQRMITSSIKSNKWLQERAQSSFPEAKAFAAEDRREITAVRRSAQKTESKNSKEKKRKRNAARKICPIADEFSYDMHESAMDYKKYKSNPIKREKERLSTENRPLHDSINWRLVNALCIGYRLNKEGLPATAEDEQAKIYDDKFIADWVSKEPERRRPYLDDLTKWAMNLDLRPAMFTDYYIRKNLPQLKEIFIRLNAFDDLMASNDGKPVYDGLSQAEKDLVKIRSKQTRHLAQVLLDKTRTKGISYNSGEYMGDEEFSAMEESSKGAGILLKKELKDGEDIFQDTRRSESELFTSEADRLAKEYLDSHTPQTPLPERAEKKIDRARILFYGGHENYEPNKDLLQRIYRRMYELADLYGQADREREAYESVNHEGKSEYMAERIKNAANRRAKEKQALESEYVREMSSYYNALSFYLNGDKLYGEGEKVLNEMGVDKKMISAERKRQAQAARAKQ